MSTDPDLVPRISARTVVLIGGGRWGRVHAGILQRLLPPEGQILWVSRHNKMQLAQRYAAGENYRPRIILFDNARDALSQRPEAAIIVTDPYTHGAVARLMLEHGVPALVEKPFVLDEEEAAALIDLAARRRLLLGAGLHLLMASYLHHFRSLWRGREIAAGRLVWFDPETDFRYGEVKRPHFSTPKIHDFFPHLWSILRVLLPGMPAEVRGAESRPLGGVRLTFSVGQAKIEAEFSRRAPKRVRRVELRFKDEGSGILDFSQEPGIATLDCRGAAPDPTWDRAPSPITIEISTFLALLDNPEVAERWPCHSSNILGSVRGAVEASAKLRESEARALAKYLASEHDPAAQKDVRALLIDNIAPDLARCGVRVEDPQTEDLLIEAAIAALGVLRGSSREPPAYVPTQFFETALRSDFLKQVTDSCAANR